EDESLPFGYWVRRRIVAGKAIGAERHRTLLARHAEFRDRWRDWMETGSVLLLPALPMVACPVEEVDESVNPLGAFARAANFIGACGMTFPAGFNVDGLPVALQILGRPFEEAALVQVC